MSKFTKWFWQEFIPSATECTPSDDVQSYFLGTRNSFCQVPDNFICQQRLADEGRRRQARTSCFKCPKPASGPVSILQTQGDPPSGVVRRTGFLCFVVKGFSPKKSRNRIETGFFLKHDVNQKSLKQDPPPPTCPLARRILPDGFSVVGFTFFLATENPLNRLVFTTNRQFKLLIFGHCWRCGGQRLRLAHVTGHRQRTTCRAVGQPHVRSVCNTKHQGTMPIKDRIKTAEQDTVT